MTDPYRRTGVVPRQVGGVDTSAARAGIAAVDNRIQEGVRQVLDFAMDKGTRDAKKEAELYDFKNPSSPEDIRKAIDNGTLPDIIGDQDTAYGQHLSDIIAVRTGSELLNRIDKERLVIEAMVANGEPVDHEEIAKQFSGMISDGEAILSPINRREAIQFGATANARVNGTYRKVLENTIGLEQAHVVGVYNEEIAKFGNIVQGIVTDPSLDKKGIKDAIELQTRWLDRLASQTNSKAVINNHRKVVNEHIADAYGSVIVDEIATNPTTYAQAIAPGYDFGPLGEQYKKHGGDIDLLRQRIIERNTEAHTEATRAREDAKRIGMGEALDLAYQLDDMARGSVQWNEAVAKLEAAVIKGHITPSLLRSFLKEETRSMGPEAQAEEEYDLLTYVVRHDITTVEGYSRVVERMGVSGRTAKNVFSKWEQGETDRVAAVKYAADDFADIYTGGFFQVSAEQALAAKEFRDIVDAEFADRLARYQTAYDNAEAEGKPIPYRPPTIQQVIGEAETFVRENQRGVEYQENQDNMAVLFGPTGTFVEQTTVTDFNDPEQLDILATIVQGDPGMSEDDKSAALTEITRSRNFSLRRNRGLLGGLFQREVDGGR